MTEYIAVIRFPESGAAYKAANELGSSVVSEQISAAAIVERAADGSITIPGGADTDADGGIATGSLIGILVGAFAGPLGLLLGWGAGALVGGLSDANRADDQEAALVALAGSIPPGSNALIVQTVEVDLDALDHFVADRGGSIVRRELVDVVAELEAEEDAAEAARKAADEQLRAQRSAERHANIQERIEKLKSRFSHKK